MIIWHPYPQFKQPEYVTVPVSEAKIGGAEPFSISKAIWYQTGDWEIPPDVGQIKFEVPLAPA